MPDWIKQAFADVIRKAQSGGGWNDAGELFGPSELSTGSNLVKAISIEAQKYAPTFNPVDRKTLALNYLNSLPVDASVQGSTGNYSNAVLKYVSDAIDGKITSFPLPAQAGTPTPIQPASSTAPSGTSAPFNPGSPSTGGSSQQSSSTAPAKAPPASALQPGMTGEAVKQLQDYLVSAGYMTQAQVNTGYGIYGPQTTAAVKALQTNLGVDNSSGPGYWGPKTIQAVQQSAPASSTGGTGSQSSSGNPNGTAGTGQSSGSSSNAASTDMFSSLIAGNPFLSNMMKDASTKAMYDNLPDNLKGLFLQTANSLGKAIQNGQTVNPAIEITPEQGRQFLDQATSELDPYYKEQAGLIKNDFNTAIDNLMTDYNKGVTREGDTFKQTLQNQSETEANAGTAFSSGRNDRQGRTVTLENNLLSDAATNVARSAQGLSRTLEGTLGSGALGTSVPGIQTYSADPLAGIFGSGGRQLYTPTGGISGTNPNAETTAIEARRSQLEQAFRTGRNLDLSTLS